MLNECIKFSMQLFNFGNNNAYTIHNAMVEVTLIRGCIRLKTKRKKENEKKNDVKIC